LDERTIEAAYRRYFPMIREKCRRVTREPRLADELAQETFARLWEARDGLRDADAIVAWLYRTATRLAIDALRRGRFELVGLPDGEEAGTGSSEIAVVRRLDATRLVARLDDDHLEIAVLRFVDGMTHPEIALASGRGERTVRRMLDRIDAFAEDERRTA